MVTHNLDITGKGCPFCVMLTRKKVNQIEKGDTLIVKLDHPPATENIPFDMKREGHKVDLAKIEPGVWEITIIKQ